MTRLLYGEDDWEYSPVQEIIRQTFASNARQMMIQQEQMMAAQKYYEMVMSAWSPEQRQQLEQMARMGLIK